MTDRCPSCGQAKPREIDGLVFDEVLWRVSWRGARLPLTRTRVRLLSMMLSRGRISTAKILNEFSGFDVLPEAARVNVSRIRKALEAAGVPIVIQSVAGWGYEILRAK